MAVLSLSNVTLSLGGPKLFDGVDLVLEPGERVGLLGRNGAGKSTLLRVVSGELRPDGGERVVVAGSRISRLAQEVPHDLEGEVFDVVASGVPELGALVARYHHLSSEVAAGSADLDALEAVQSRLEAAGGWLLNTRVETALSRLDLPAEGRFETLSGGLARRVLLARALVADPDVLLLDEPTNHLDIPAIEWLEELVTGMSAAVLLVTHDRAFLKRVATRIVELDRGRLRSYPGDYALFIQRREADAEVEGRQLEKQDKKLAQEEVWIRQGVKARRTRDEGRVRALERLREEVRQRRAQLGRATLRFEQAGLAGKLVIEAEGLGFSYGDKTIVRDFSTVVCRGDKIGILGRNGTGKTTLLRLLLGELAPQAGTVRCGTNLAVAYFDQHREQLDDELSVADSVAEGNDRLSIGGKPIHVISYLQSFLFAPDQMRSPVRSLSGGERNRLLLARLFTRPFNVLVMDEPTNDLDVETLELLEDKLVDFSGTLLLVSHDRAFLDNVVTSTLVMEGDGRVGQYAGGYTDWLTQRPAAVAAVRPALRGVAPLASGAVAAERGKKRKLTNRERQDLEALPKRIEGLEAERKELHARLADPEIYRQGPYREGQGERLGAARERLTALEGELESAYQRWAELEG